MKQHLRKIFQAGWMPLAKWIGRSYVAGTQLAEALQTCRSLSQQGVASTACFWNKEGDDPKLVANAYRDILSALAQEDLDCYLSIKALPLNYDRNLMAKLCEQARAAGIRIHFDSLGPEEANQTFALITEFSRQFPQLSCTLPGRWRRSLRDADLAVELGLKVRVVKGQWADPLHPDLDARAGFLDVIDRLAGRARHVAVATHDPILARAALQRLRAAGTPCELELLLGLPQKAVRRAVKDLGLPVRMYVPYGEAWLPYRLSQVRKNPRILWWVMCDALMVS
jgi:proline dehydrogenase